MSNPFQTTSNVHNSVARKIHELKCHPHFFAAVVAGKKTFDIRRNDRAFRVGDMLNFSEFDPSFGMTGRHIDGLEVIYIMTDEDFPAILPGFVIMGLRGAPFEAEDEVVIGTIDDDPQVFPSLDKRCYAYREIAGEPYDRAMPCPVCVNGKCMYEGASS